MTAQLELFSHSDDSRLRWVMLSLQPQYYQELCQGSKKTEFRRGAFVREPFQGFVYCSSPVMAVGAYVKFGQPVVGVPEAIAGIKEAELPGSYDMMMAWMAGCSEATAIPVEAVISFNPVTLQELRERFSTFHPPQRYLYLDKMPELLAFLKQHIGLL